MFEVYCYDLKRGEVDELIILLEEIKFKLIFVEKNSIKAVKEGEVSGSISSQEEIGKRRI